MQINDAEVIVVCDVDQTLIKSVNPILEKANILIVNPYNKKEYWYDVHWDHVDLLRMYKGRGFYIRVWTANGVQHAVSVIKALGLDDGTVDSIETKPMKHIDDKKNSIHIAGARVFIPRPGWSEEA